MNTTRPVLVFDSGIGGLSVLREMRVLLPERHFVYVADDAGFPYGDWKEEVLRAHLLALFGNLLKKYKPQLCVVACNTASTLAINDLRAAFPDCPFVGTVPAIKPAAEQTGSGVIAVLATPGTVKRAYTRALVTSFAGQCFVRLVGSRKLAAFAEAHLRGQPVDMAALAAEIAPCFVEKKEQRTDIVVLACTHYPFLINLLRKVAPWPVDWLDPAEAIARRVRSLLPDDGREIDPLADIAGFTSGKADFATRRLLHGFGFKYEAYA
ncbi:MAG: Glutamate racemase [Candidatus Tokpelaia hoelldobleri]|uniref:Glutamate racemase n=1 Tax=Candidatus Tokpelaia hoelldobleri TaxID=1902579 RepID=A0A1U9JUZ7_9HYPH|nr:MAG: Glutamate racemase [Candidatus Tokpelaia hoelldoblerii]